MEGVAFSAANFSSTLEVPWATGFQGWFLVESILSLRSRGAKCDAFTISLRVSTTTNYLLCYVWALHVCTCMHLNSSYVCTLWLTALNLASFSREYLLSACRALTSSLSSLSTSIFSMVTVRTLIEVHPFLPDKAHQQAVTSHRHTITRPGTALKFEVMLRSSSRRSYCALCSRIIRVCVWARVLELSTWYIICVMCVTVFTALVINVVS